MANIDDAMADDDYSLTEISDATGIEARTIRSYIERGLLPGAHMGCFAGSACARRADPSTYRSMGVPLAQDADSIKDVLQAAAKRL